MEAFLNEAWTELQLVPRLAVALVLGGIVGYERETADRPAGLRTHMLVCVSSALLVVFADLIVFRYEDATHARIDPMRVMEAIVGGISFIGAGTIFVSGAKQAVRGLTTAASLFAVAILGIGCGLGMYALSVLVAIVVVAILRVLAWIEHRSPLAQRHEDRHGGDQPEPDEQ